MAGDKRVIDRHSRYGKLGVEALDIHLTPEDQLFSRDVALKCLATGFSLQDMVS